jgi:hypothetical protein
MSRPTGKDRYKEIQSQFAAQPVTPPTPKTEVPKPVYGGHWKGGVYVEGQPTADFSPTRHTGADYFEDQNRKAAAQQTPAAPEPERIPRPGLPNNNIYDRAADWQPGYAQGSQAQDSTVEMLSLDPKIKRIIKRVNDLGYGAAITPQGIRYGGQIMSFEHWDLKVKG